ncbi:hypothetical protein CYMTET_43326 [Cymbomonas tetramitiformis]|uniref:Secreted protein n=1 Tax=Cymbomonas tetramitiformis TaxID=36881 RepID=A0AAE0C2A3_9CHLO|nr:hypothetical protein CYMTET_43326 [Cymbomonas tetramitiformis]
MVNAMSTQMFSVLRIVFSLVLFTASRGNRMVLEIFGSRLFRLCYTYAYLRSKLMDLADARSQNIPALFSPSSGMRKVPAFICDNWQRYRKRKYDRIDAANAMRIGVQRGVWHALGSVECEGVSTEPSVPLHKVTSEMVLERVESKMMALFEMLEGMRVSSYLASAFRSISMGV